MRRLYLFIAVSFLLCVSPVFSAGVIGGGGVVPGVPGLVNGDVNGDSTITLADVLYNMRTLAKITNQTADFGDLDDQSTGFPTTLNTANAIPGRTGPYHRNVTHEWIGSSPSTTTDTEPDAKIIDLDYDDAIFEIYPITSGGQPTNVGVIKVPIGTDSDPAVRYLNVAADFNNDGMFQSYQAPSGDWQPEWIVANLPVQFRSKEKSVSTSFTLADPNALIAYPCMRFTLSTELIDPSLFAGGWDGSGPAGGFERGETEDWCFDPQGSPTPQVYDWPAVYGALPPPYDDAPPLQWPNPEPPIIDGPGNPNPPVIGIPAGKKAEGGGGVFTETEAPGGMVELPDGDQDIFKKKAYIPEMVGTKQTEDYDCMPTCAANSIQYLLEKARMIGDIQESEETGGTIFEGIPPWPEHAEEFVRNKLKEAMKTGGMMDHPQGKGTTLGGFMAGKKTASNALKGVIGTGLTTKERTHPSFNHIFQAVAKGRDVEIVLTFKPESDPPQGHMVIVTGATMDQNGNMTLTFSDPLHPEKGEQTYTVSNGAPKNSSDAENKSGVEVKNYPGAGGKRAEITHIFEEYLTDVQ